MKKKKATLEEMIKIFDEMWARNPSEILVWEQICSKHGWTAKEFDEELYNWQVKDVA